MPSSPLLFFLFLLTASPAAFFFSSLLPAAGNSPRFAEAPLFRNGDHCLSPFAAPCNPSFVHTAMTLDSHYLRGSIAAVYSILKHAVFFHFVAPVGGRHGLPETPTVRSVFPSLHFKVYPFQEDLVTGLISSSVRQAPDNSLNYARAYLADLLPVDIWPVQDLHLACEEGF